MKRWGFSRLTTDLPAGRKPTPGIFPLHCPSALSLSPVPSFWGRRARSMARAKGE